MLKSRISAINRLSYNIWNIGFIECNIKDVILSDQNVYPVKWVKHSYKDRFFADPFILSISDSEIKVLVEDYPFYSKKGVISLLTIDRKTYELLNRKVVLKQPYHMSYPFIYRDNNSCWVAPEASMSGNLYRYLFNDNTEILDHQVLMIDEPLLDSTIVKYNQKWWLFCTKRGDSSNSKLYLYFSDSPEGPWTSHKMNPVCDNPKMARPAGYMVEIDNRLYRVIQKCDNFYGESINISLVDVLSEDKFHEIFIKNITTDSLDYSNGFHTINCLENLCVVDGVKTHFRPFRRLFYELINYFLSK